MRNHFFIERYALDKHEAYLRQADHDRLARRLHDPRAEEQQVFRRAPRVHAGPPVAALVAIVALALATGTAFGFAAVVDRLTVDRVPVAESGAVESDAPGVQPYRHVVDRWYQETAGTARASQGAHVVDRWYDAPGSFEPPVVQTPGKPF